MTTQVDELRDVMAANYEDVRSAFAGLRDGDLRREAGPGRPLFRLVAEVVMAPGRDARAAGRIADGKRAGVPPIPRAIDAISGWRGRRVFAKAERSDVLTAWENAFTELFSFVNDLAAGEIDAESPASNENRIRAWDYLSVQLALWPVWAAELRAATRPVSTP